MAQQGVGSGCRSLVVAGPDLADKPGADPVQLAYHRVDRVHRIRQPATHSGGQRICDRMADSGPSRVSGRLPITRPHQPSALGVSGRWVAG
jgi:hypothetical protein